MKRYRRPKIEEGEIRFQRGKIDGEVDMCIYYGDEVPRCDRALVMYTLGEGSYSILTKSIGKSLVDELENRGYDIDTLRFSVKRKKQE